MAQQYSLSIILKAIDQTVAPFREMKNRVDGLRRQFEQLKQPVAELPQGIDRASSAMGRFGRSVETVARHVSKMRENLASIDVRKLQEQNVTNRNNYGVQAVHTYGLARGAFEFVKPAIEFETAMSNVRRKMDFADPINGLKEMQKTILDLSKELPLSAKEFAEIISEGAAQGIKESEAIPYAKTIANMATAWDATPAFVAEQVGMIKNILELPMSEMAKMGDVINKLADTFSAKETGIIDGIKRTGGALHLYGMKMPEIAAWSTGVQSLGQTAEIASTGLNAMAVKLAAAPMGSKGFLWGLNEMRLDPKKVQKEMLTRPSETMFALLTRFREMAKTDKAKAINIISEMFGMEYSDNILAMTAGLDTVRSALNLAAKEENYLGSMSKEMQERLKTTAAQLGIFQNRLTEISINLGAVILPIMNSVLEYTGPHISSLAKFAKENPELVKGIGVVIAGLIGLKVALVGFGWLFSWVKGAGLGLFGLLQKIGLFGRAGGAAGAAGLAAGLLKGGVQPVFVVNMPGSGFGGLPGIGDLGKAAKGGAVKDALGGGLGAEADKIKKASLGARIKSMLPNAGKMLKGAGPLAVLAGLLSFGSSALDGDGQGMSEAVGGTAGGLGGGALGAAIGTAILPGIGTIIGGALGGWLGSEGGSAITGSIYQAWSNRADKPTITGSERGPTKLAEEMAAWARGEKPAQKVDGKMEVTFSGLPAGVTATATRTGGDLDVLAKSGPSTALAFG